MKVRWKNFDLDSVLTSPPVLWMISITIAIIMWNHVRDLDESTYIYRSVSIPLQYQGYDQSQAVLRNRIYEVDVRVRGPEEEILRLKPDDLTAYVDARGLALGSKYTDNVKVSTPGNIALTSVSPSQVEINLVRQVSRLMTVGAELPPNLPAGTYLDETEILPKEVTVRGSEEDVAKVAKLRVFPTAEELMAGHEFLIQVKMDQSESFNGNVVIEPEQVRFRGALVRGLPKKRVPVITHTSGVPNSDYYVRSIITDPSEVQIEGKEDKIASVEAVDTEIFDINGIDADRVIVVPLKQPEIEGVTFVGTSSVKVSIHMIEARAERMLTNVPVEIRGTESPQNWMPHPSNVSVTIAGKPSLIESFNPESLDLKAYTDLTNIFMDSATLPVKTEIVSGDKFSVTRVEPQNVTVNMLNR